MDRLQTTEDGSHTLYSEHFNAHYHSTHGAIQESKHIFIAAGLIPKLAQGKRVDVLEMGFGTGLNVLLTHQQAKARQHNITYTTVEAYPIELEIATQLNYCESLGLPEFQQTFLDYHQNPWGQWQNIDHNFSLLKLNETLEAVVLPSESFDLIYFDAFSPEQQPQLWQEPIMDKMYAALSPHGLLVTYCAKGAFKRTLKAAGFEIEGLPGPKGKREMVRAQKP